MQEGPNCPTNVEITINSPLALKTINFHELQKIPISDIRIIWS
jgi:hypothetical protein